MLIKFLSGPKAGQTAHYPRTQQTQLLVDTGFIEVIEDDVPAPGHGAKLTPAQLEAFRHPKISFGIGKTGDHSYIVLTRGDEKIPYPGPTDRFPTIEEVNAWFKASGYPDIPPVPQAVYERYLQIGPTAFYRARAEDAAALQQAERQHR